MRLLRRDSLAAVPWANGRGVAFDLARDGGEPLAWRLALARLDGPAPFSPMPGLDRTLALLEGAATLLVAGRRAVLGEAPLAFPGEAAVEVLEGSALVLNAMTRRGARRHAMRRLAPGEGAAGPLWLVAAEGGARLADGTELAPGDALHLPAGETAAPLPGSRLLAVSFRAWAGAFTGAEAASQDGGPVPPPERAPP